MPEETFSRIRLDREGPLARLILDRPEVRNAFDETLLAELTAAAAALAVDRSVRVVLLSGEGKAFCAGADLDWMRRMAGFTFEENLTDARGLAECLRRLWHLPQPVVGRVHGPVIGGGMGLVAICDIVVASTAAVFGFSEVKLGLSPACISPYVIRRMGEGPCHELFLTGERFDARRAERLGLVQRLTAPVDLDDEVDRVVAGLLTSGPDAAASCKDLLRRVPGMPLDEAVPYTAETIARLRAGDEGKEGVRSFLERRRPSWTAASGIEP